MYILYHLVRMSDPTFTVVVCQYGNKGTIFDLKGNKAFKHNPYSMNSARYCDITRKLAFFVSSCNIANRKVENLNLRDLLSTLDTRCQVPGRSSIHTELNRIMIELMAKICVYIQSASAISICCDIWSKKGLTSSYLGITAHFFSRNDHCSDFSCTLPSHFPHGC